MHQVAVGFLEGAGQRGHYQLGRLIGYEMARRSNPIYDPVD
jgi:hypothetical protein